MEGKFITVGLLVLKTHEMINTIYAPFKINSKNFYIIYMNRATGKFRVWLALFYRFPFVIFQL